MIVTDVIIADTAKPTTAARRHPRVARGTINHAATNSMKLKGPTTINSHPTSTKNFSTNPIPVEIDRSPDQESTALIRQGQWRFETSQGIQDI